MRRAIVGRFWLALVVAWVPGSAPADDWVAEALGRSLLPKGQPLADVQHFVEQGVRPLPPARSVEEWEAEASRIRSEARARVLFRGEAAAWRDAPVRVEWLDSIETGPGYTLKRLRYEAIPGLWVPALLYMPEKVEGKVPVVLNVNGHDAKGKAADYKQIRCINLAKRGILALNVEWFGMGQFRTDGNAHPLINHLDLCGTSGVGAHYLLMTKALDLLLDHPNADPTRVGVTGLSGGGWQTIFVSAFEPRVTLAVPVAGYSSFLTRVRNFSDLGDSEQTPVDLGTVADYSTMTALLAPRPALLVYNAKDDCCFAAAHALPPLLEAARPIYKLYGQEARLRSHINDDPGTHNYALDNRQALYRMLADHFFPARQDASTGEIPSESEVKSPEALNVPLPADNLDLHQLARKLSETLPRNPGLPTTRAEAEAWVRSGRDRLREIVRSGRPEAVTEPVATEERDGLRAVFSTLRIDGAWTVPVVELSKGSPKSTVLLLVDEGRARAATDAAALVEAGHRVVALDTFYFGESKPVERDYLWALLVSTIGDRPLGVQAGQVGAAARWLRGRNGDSPVGIVAIGPRSSVVAMVAAALEPEAIGDLELRGSLGSLKELIETRASFNSSPELFCFGLLESFDVLQLAALSAPRKVVFPGASERAKSELTGLKAWYGIFGVDHEPIR